MEYYPTIKKSMKGTLYVQINSKIMSNQKNKQDWVVVSSNAHLKDNAAKTQGSLYVAIMIIVTFKEKGGWDWRDTGDHVVDGSQILYYKVLITKVLTL
jgi:hypothetical protein